MKPMAKTELSHLIEDTAKSLPLKLSLTHIDMLDANELMYHLGDHFLTPITERYRDLRNHEEWENFRISFCEAVLQDASDAWAKAWKPDARSQGKTLPEEIEDSLRHSLDYYDIEIDL